ncbi:helicase associated domain-containing protein [Streptacidiphilus sp. PAMC 29251]
MDMRPRSTPLNGMIGYTTWWDTIAPLHLSSAAAGYAAEHGHACPPGDAVFNAKPVGVILKNLRTAQRRTEALQRRAEAGEGGLDWAGALSPDRKAALDAIDPAWCPTGWSLEWQRSFTLARRHIQAGGKLLGAAPGSIAAQGEDLAGWARMQQPCGCC